MNTLPDFGESKLHSMNMIIHARRTPLEELSLWQKATAMFDNNDLSGSLSTLKLKGFQPHDFVERQVRWGSLKHSTDALIDFGFKWSHMIAMNFQPNDFQKLEWKHLQKLQITAKEMMQTCMSVHDLVALKLTPQQLHELGWTWDNVKTIGGTRDNVCISEQDIDIYFGQKKESTPAVSRSISRFKF